MKDSDKPKLIVAVVVLVIAAALLAWNFNLFGGGSTAPPSTGAPAPHSGGPRTAPGG